MLAAVSLFAGGALSDQRAKSHPKRFVKLSNKLQATRNMKKDRCWNPHLFWRTACEHRSSLVQRDGNRHLNRLPHRRAEDSEGRKQMKIYKTSPVCVGTWFLLMMGMALPARAQVAASSFEELRSALKLRE